jgi:hypothetical protein
LQEILKILFPASDEVRRDDLLPVADALARRLQPDQAGQVLGQALQVLDQTKDVQALITAAELTGPMAERLTPDQADQAVRRLLDTLSRTTDWTARFRVLEAVARLAPRLRPDRAADALPALLDSLPPGADWQALAQFAATVETLAGGQPAAVAAINRTLTGGLTEVLKQPGSVEAVREWTLAELARRARPVAAEGAGGYAAVLTVAPLSPLGVVVEAAALEARYPGGRQPFRDLWDAVTWLRQHRPDLDLAAPPRRAHR